MGPSWRIALLEVRRQTSGIDRRTVLTVLLMAGFLAVVWGQALEEGVRPDDGVFPIQSDPFHPLRAAAEADGRFDVTVGGTSFLDGDAVLWLHDGVVFLQTGPGGGSTMAARAATEALEQAVGNWLNTQLQREGDEAAAFPVRVDVVFAQRSDMAAASASPDGGDPDDPTDPSGDGGPGEPAPGDDSEPGSGDNSEPGSDDDPEPGPGDAVDDGLAGRAPERADVRTGLRPGQVEPPFPMRSLLLTFAYMVPMNLLGQAYSGTLLSERVRDRGVQLLAAPATGAQVLWGKTIPYAAATLLLAIGVTWFVGATWVGLLGALCFLAFLLAASALLGVTARNLRELTFFQVGLTTSTSLLLFLPAIFTALPSIAFLSPVHVVASSIRGDPIPFVPFIYATVPLLLATVALAVTATALYREETLFGGGSPLTKMMAGIRTATPSHLSLLAAGSLAVPFAYAAQILVVIFAVTLDLRVAFLVFLFGGALVEEVVKAVPAWAHGRHASRWTGVLTGTGFFVAEKLVLLLGLTAFTDLPFAAETLAAFGGGGWLLLLLPLLLHTVTASLSTWGARNGRTWAVAGLLGAVAVHVGYNAVLVMGVLA